MNILGISAYYHDSAACLVRDGRVLAAAQEERFTRSRHDPNFPVNAIRYCMREGGISPAELDCVCFYDKPILKFHRLLVTFLSYAPRGLESFLTAMPIWLRRKLFVENSIREELAYHGEVLFAEHHESHAASAFYPSPYQEAAFLTLDGVGEWATATYGIGTGNQLQILAEIEFPNSLGLLYSAFTYYVGFKVNSGEYKVMGLAPYGEPKYKDLILDRLIDLREDGSFQINTEYFEYPLGLRMINEKFEQLFGGPARKPESRLTQREMDLARSVQEVTEEVVLRMARHVRKETGMPHLCLAGGVALNCVVNGKLLRERIFDDVWIQPAAGDAGGALGAALSIWYQYYGNSRRVDGKEDAMYGSLLGPQFTRVEIKRYLDGNHIPYEELSDQELPGRIADLIASENVIGWFQGRMEFGPRALGARSIIGDARSPKMQETMNLKIKYRESFRPFAPSVLDKDVSDWFDIDRASPYMLLVADIRKAKQRAMTEEQQRYFGLQKLYVLRSEIPAVTHVDYSARVQTVSRETNPLYYDTIAAFHAKSGCPVIVNTSFNVRGEPLVCTPREAFLCFMRTHMDYLVMGNYLLDKSRQEPLKNDVDWRKQFELD